jgi:hypothetical protein
LQVLIKLRSSLFADEVVDKSSVKSNARYSRSGYNAAVPHVQALMRSNGFKSFLQQLVDDRTPQLTSGSVQTLESKKSKRATEERAVGGRDTPDSETRQRKRTKQTEEKKKQKKARPSVATSPDFGESDSQ